MIAYCWRSYKIFSLFMYFIYFHIFIYLFVYFATDQMWLLVIIFYSWCLSSLLLLAFLVTMDDGMNTIIQRQNKFSVCVNYKNRPKVVNLVCPQLIIIFLFRLLYIFCLWVNIFISAMKISHISCLFRFLPKLLILYIFFHIIIINSIYYNTK